MNPTRWRIAALLVLALVAQLLLGCGATETSTELETPPSPSFAAFGTPVPAFAMPVPIIVVQANPTQERIQDRQTDTGGDSAAAAATLTANQVRQTVVAQAQVIVAGELTQTAQSVDATNAAPMAATAIAATQTVLLVQEYQHEQDNFVNRIVTPLIPIMAAILFLMLVVLVIILLRRQFLPRQWLNSNRNTREENNYPNSLITIDGEISDYYNRTPHPANPTDPAPGNVPRLPCEKLVYVEVVNANELPVIHWIDDVERQLADEHGGGK
jgi:uncharacterized membrane protein